MVDCGVKPQHKQTNEDYTQLTCYSINKNFQRKIVNKFLPINSNICFWCSKEHVLGAQKNRLIEKVLLSTNNICFG